MKHKIQHGFTLIEMLVYLALFAFIMTSAMAGAYQIVEGSNRNRGTTLRTEEEHFIFRKIDSIASSVVTIVEPDDEGDTLILETSAGDRFEFKAEDGVMLLNDIPLSNGITDIDNFEVQHSFSPESVSVTFTLDGEPSSTSTFYIQ